MWIIASVSDLGSKRWIFIQQVGVYWAQCRKGFTARPRHTATDQGIVSPCSRGCEQERFADQGGPLVTYQSVKRQCGTVRQNKVCMSSPNGFEVCICVLQIRASKTSSEATMQGPLKRRPATFSTGPPVAWISHLWGKEERWACFGFEEWLRIGYINILRVRTV